uniref:Prostaglandin E synthase 3 n=1 Tax=Cercocebus atys TaxID=9531 RepID=A0A2K5KUA3_CERAT
LSPLPNSWYYRHAEMHKRTDRSILCCLRKGESGQSWPRLTKERAKLNWLSVDFNNWKDWEDDSDEDMSNFDRFSEDVDLPEVDSQDSDDESKCFFFFFLHSDILHQKPNSK